MVFKPSMLLKKLNKCQFKAIKSLFTHPFYKDFIMISYIIMSIYVNLCRAKELRSIKFVNDLVGLHGLQKSIALFIPVDVDTTYCNATTTKNCY